MNTSGSITVARVSPILDQGSGQFIKLNHLGELIAINIYQAQLQVCRWTAPTLLPLLAEFLAHEQRHHRLFAEVLAERDIEPCRASVVFGAAGFLLGLLTSLFGRVGVLACTAAVETVVLDHLSRQLIYLRQLGDWRAVATIESILSEEIEHRDTGARGGGASLLYKVLYALVAPGTACVIAIGMHL